MNNQLNKVFFYWKTLFIISIIIIVIISITITIITIIIINDNFLKFSHQHVSQLNSDLTPNAQLGRQNKK